MKLLYDAFFKEIMNPEYDAGRLEEFLSELLKQRVKIVKVLPNDSVRIAVENSLLVTDLVVELADGSLANIEIQKIGYRFPGERAACYSADLLLRQYKRIRLITAYPRFKPLYEEIYRLCLNTEKIMGLFSKELQILDENTVQYMMDEMQETINKQQGTINEMQEQLGEKNNIIEEKDAAIWALQERIRELEAGQK